MNQADRHRGIKKLKGMDHRRIYQQLMQTKLDLIRCRNMGGCHARFSSIFLLPEKTCSTSELFIISAVCLCLFRLLVCSLCAAQFRISIKCVSILQAVLIRKS